MAHADDLPEPREWPPRRRARRRARSGRTKKHDPRIPALILSRHGSARVAYMPADIDRQYARDLIPDHAALLANVVRWAADASLPLVVEGLA